MSSGPGQVDYPARQGAFHSHLPSVQGLRKTSANLIKENQTLKSACPEGKLVFKASLSHAKILRVGDIVKWLTSEANSVLLPAKADQ